MKKKHKYLRKKKLSPVPVLSCVAAVLAVVLIGQLLFILKNEYASFRASTEPTQTTPIQIAVPTESSAPESTAPPTQETTLPPEPKILPYLAEMAEENGDLAGWIRIDGTALDYPVMFTPDDEEKYLHRDMKGNFSVGGLPFISASCSLEPRSDNLILYGHNMANGTMFHSLMNYDQVTYYQAHPTIQFSTLYEEETYEVVAALYDRIYLTTDDCFKFYQFIDPENEAEFDQGIAYFKEHSLYDTGVTAEYGDKLITLVTCAYHVDNGRFVVVARQSG